MPFLCGISLYFPCLSGNPALRLVRSALHAQPGSVRLCTDFLSLWKGYLFPPLSGDSRCNSGNRDTNSAVSARISPRVSTRASSFSVFLRRPAEETGSKPAETGWKIRRFQKITGAKWGARLRFRSHFKICASIPMPLTQKVRFRGVSLGATNQKSFHELGLTFRGDACS